MRHATGHARAGVELVIEIGKGPLDLRHSLQLLLQGLADVMGSHRGMAQEMSTSTK